MASYGESAAARIRFDDDALANAYLKAGELMKGTLQGIADKERQDYKDKLEQERLDREEARQVERDRKADILFKRDEDRYNKELATDEALKSQSKIGIMGYQEGTGLLGKYAEAANAEADKAYNEAMAAGKTEDDALTAYSAARSEAGKKLWNDQQKELKYSNTLIDTAREMARGNLSDIAPIDRVKLTQSLATLDLPFLQKQKEASANLATELFKNVSNDKELNAASKEYTKTTGQNVPADVLSSLSKEIRAFKNAVKLEDIKHGYDVSLLKTKTKSEGSKPDKPTEFDKKISITFNSEAQRWWNSSPGAQKEYLKMYGGDAQKAFNAYVGDNKVAITNSALRATENLKDTTVKEDSADFSKFTDANKIGNAKDVENTISSAHAAGMSDSAIKTILNRSALGAGEISWFGLNNPDYDLGLLEDAIAKYTNK